MPDNHINFTKKTLDSLSAPANGKRLYFYDTKVHGLEFMITDKGARSFKVYRKFDGKPVRITLGKYPEMGVELARKEAQHAIAELNTGINPNIEKKKLARETKFGELFEHFVEKYSRANKKNMDG